MRLRRLLLTLAVLGLVCWISSARAEEPRPIKPTDFDKLLKLIKPQPGELRFHDVPWLLNVHEARTKAAAEGKPILIWSGSGGAPLGAC
jgi:hypothetical protein